MIKGPYFHEQGWEDYTYWQTEDRKTLKKINQLIRDIKRSPYEGIGHPEPLKHKYQGYWSRHIDKYNRIVYRIEDNKLEIAQCKAHYDD